MIHCVIMCISNFVMGKNNLVLKNQNVFFASGRKTESEEFYAEVVFQKTYIHIGTYPIMHRYLLYRLHPFDLGSKLFQKPFCKTLHRIWDSPYTRFDSRCPSKIGESRNAPCLFGRSQSRTLGLARRMAPFVQIPRFSCRTSCLCKH